MGLMQCNHQYHHHRWVQVSTRNNNRFEFDRHISAAGRNKWHHGELRGVVNFDTSYVSDIARVYHSVDATQHKEGIGTVIAQWSDAHSVLTLEDRRDAEENGSCPDTEVTKTNIGWSTQPADETFNSSSDSSPSRPTRKIPVAFELRPKTAEKPYCRCQPHRLMSDESNVRLEVLVRALEARVAKLEGKAVVADGPGVAMGQCSFLGRTAAVDSYSYFGSHCVTLDQVLRLKPHRATGIPNFPLCHSLPPRPRRNRS
jgi:hypothetical protein